jgi:UTP--glucose-1-phosphate uridylyltransferase
MKAVIPAAGFGTRFLPATKAQPKEMLPIVDKPAIQYVVEEAAASGIDDICIVTGRGKRSIEDHFDRAVELEYVLANSEKHKSLDELAKILDFNVDIFYIRQKTQKGLGHAVWCARKHIGNEFFAVLLGDDIIVNTVPCTRQLIDIHKKYSCSVIAVQPVPMDRVNQYGIIKGKEVADGIYKLEDMVEKPSPQEATSNLASIGRYVLSPTIFGCIESTKLGVGREIQLTDALKALLKKEDVYAHVFKGKRYDIGHKIDLIKATIELGLEREEFREELNSFIRKKLGC